MMSLIFGGSGSGKSEYAETRIGELSDGGLKYYLATMQVFGEEGKRRVERHRRLRDGKGFITIERTDSVAEAVPDIENAKAASVLLECMSNLTANEMFRDNGFLPAEPTAEKIIKEIRELKAHIKNLVIVTGNVFEDGIRYEEGTMRYLDALGRVNRELAAMADEVVEVVAGIPIRIKEAP